jgi:hypothetical protein
MAQRLRREHQRVEINLLEIFRRLLPEFDIRITSAGIDLTGMVRPIGVGWQETATMSCDDL